MAQVFVEMPSTSEWMPSRTPFRALSPWVARGALATLVFIFVVLLAVAFAYRDPPPAHPGDGDLALYGRIVARLQAGEPYYPAAHAEMLAGHYGTLSVPGWRMPFYLSLVSLFPTVDLAQGALIVLTLMAAATALLVLLRTAGRITAIAITPFLFVTLGGCLVPGVVLYSEYACGILVLLSAMCFALDRRSGGFIIGVLALFVRELALPYVLVCLLLAWQQGRRREVSAWLASLIAYVAYYGWHAYMVISQLGPADGGTTDGWLRFGGASFLVSAASFAGLLASAPMYVAAVFLVFALVGIIAWPDGADRTTPLTVLVYLFTFAFVGKPLDRYWGEIYTPLLTLGLAWTLPALRDLIGAAAARRNAAAESRAARCALGPAGKLAPDQRLDHRHARFAVVEAGDGGKLFAARFTKRLRTTNGDLFQRLQAVCREARHHHRDLLHPAFRKLRQRHVGVGR